MGPENVLEWVCGWENGCKIFEFELQKVLKSLTNGCDNGDFCLSFLVLLLPW